MWAGSPSNEREEVGYEPRLTELEVVCVAGQELKLACSIHCLQTQPILQTHTGTHVHTSHVKRLEQSPHHHYYSAPTTTAALPTHDPTHGPTHLLVELALLKCVDLLILTSFVEPEPLGGGGEG